MKLNKVLARAYFSGANGHFGGTVAARRAVFMDSLNA